MRILFEVLTELQSKLWLKTSVVFEASGRSSHKNIKLRINPKPYTLNPKPYDTGALVVRMRVLSILQ